MDVQVGACFHFLSVKLILNLKYTFIFVRKDKIVVYIRNLKKSDIYNGKTKTFDL